MAPPKIKLYVDINAPTFKNCEISYVPILLGGVMKACGNTPPISIKNKDKWIGVERDRWAKVFNIPIGDVPEGFPVNTVLPMRALTAIYQSNPDKFIPAVEALYGAFWVNANKVKINTPEGLHSVLKSALGDELAQKAVKESSGDAAKKGLSANTDAALSDGAFGLPWFVATNPSGQTECYWGVDHLGQLCDHLGIERGNNGGMRAMI